MLRFIVLHSHGDEVVKLDINLHLAHCKRFTLTPIFAVIKEKEGQFEINIMTSTAMVTY